MRYKTVSIFETNIWLSTHNFFAYLKSSVGGLVLSFQNGIVARLNNWINYTQRIFIARNVAVDLDVANIIVRGRKNLQNLKETEQMVFKKYL